MRYINPDHTPTPARSASALPPETFNLPRVSVDKKPAHPGSVKAAAVPMGPAQELAGGGGGGGGAAGWLDRTAADILDDPNFVTGSLANKAYGTRFTVKAAADPITVVKLRILAPAQSGATSVRLWISNSSTHVREAFITAVAGEWVEADIDPYELTPGQDYAVSGNWQTMHQLNPADPVVVDDLESVVAVSATSGNINPVNTVSGRYWGFADFIRG